MRGKNKTRQSRQAFNGFKQMSLLPAPNYNPKWPKKNTHVHKALCLMLQGKAINALDFEEETASQRLPVSIDILSNKLGWPVLREDVPIRLKSKPKTRLFRKYYFDSDFIDAIKKIAGGVVW